MAETIHLRPHAPVAARVLVPGDPGRALRLAQALTGQPKMVNHNRGLWGYTGTAADGELLTIQSTGMGGPSAAIVVEELIALGARRVVRVGTCGAIAPGFSLGEVVTAERVLGGDGASRALGAAEAQTPALRDAGRAVTVASVDLFYGEDVARWSRAGAHVVEMEAAAVLAVCAAHDVPAGVLLCVSDLLAGDERERIGPEALETAELALGERGLSLLSA